MLRLLTNYFLIFIFAFSLNAFAQQSGGGGNDLKDTCEISGGTWTGSSGGNWACCWADWGCYGCVDGNCKIKCTTPQCRKANGMGKVNSNEQRVQGLAPAGMKSPIVPRNPKMNSAPMTMHNAQ